MRKVTVPHSIRAFCLAGLTFGVIAACATVAPAPDPRTGDVVAVAPVAAPEAEADTPPASEVSFSAEGLLALETTMGDYVRDGRLYGIHTRLAHKGEIVSDYFAGFRDAETGKPIEPDTIYRIYSMSKPVTGVAMMMLWEEGLFELDDPVSKYVPEFADLKVLAGVDEDGSAILADLDRQPTMRELMSHTSGLAYGISGTDPVNAAYRDLKVLESPDLQTFIDRTVQIPLLHPPGTAWEYSVGMDVQGYIIEQLSGQSFASFLETRLFGPLGMKDTGFFVPDEDYDRLGAVYGFDPETGDMVPVPFPSVMFRRETIGFASGGGGLVSTMEDYSRFAQMLVNQGELNGVRILKPETVDLMRTNVLPDGVLMSYNGRLLPGTGMGLTIGTVEDAETAETAEPDGTYFWSGAAGTWFWIDPVNEAYFIGMVQIFAQNKPGEPLALREASAKAVYDALQAE